MHRVSMLISLLLSSVVLVVSPDAMAQEPAATPGVTSDASLEAVATPADLRSPAEYVAEITLGTGSFPSASSGVAVDDNGALYVIDSLHDQILVFDRDGNAVATWGESGSAPGQFVTPVGAAVDAQGNLYVADYNGNRVQVFAPDGTPLGIIGSIGKGPGQFITPIYLTIGPDRLLYVAEEGNRRVQVFRLLPPLGPGAGTPAP